jgi:hypothetical protein
MNIGSTDGNNRGTKKGFDQDIENSNRRNIPWTFWGASLITLPIIMEKPLGCFLQKSLGTLMEGKQGDGMVISFGVSCHALPTKKKVLQEKN